MFAPLGANSPPARRSRAIRMHSEGPRGPSEPPDGWCGRRVRRRAGVGAARRVSCAGRALETLTPCGGRGRAASMARAAGAGTRLPRRETGARGGGFAGRCAGAWSGGARGWVRRGAFLAPEGRSKRSRRAGGRGRTAPMARAVGAKRKKRGPCRRARAPLCLPRDEKIFSVKEILFINEKKFFSGRGKDEESPPPLGRRAEQPGGKDRCGRAFSKPFRR